MKTATVSDFRTNMMERLDEVQRDQDVLILSGPKSKDFVLMTLEAYNSMEETAYLLSTSTNAARLIEGIEQDAANKVAHSLVMNLEERPRTKIQVRRTPRSR
ncbi:MAG: type II toxin-antitoxin system Phd/YefM family antitoxin [Cytophagales bacterium]|jgi:antitoxin YefM|nr:type II toxin-antitoxin system Phd/YefM family antitoxin [Cytophagales bacterium]